MRSLFHRLEYNNRNRYQKENLTLAVGTVETTIPWYFITGQSEFLVCFYRQKKEVSTRPIYVDEYA